jgi:hypothetical protein
MATNMLSTVSDMESLDVVIRQFVENTGRLPDGLSELPNPNSNGVPFETVDGWGGPISFSKSSDGKFELRAKRISAGVHYQFSRSDSGIRVPSTQAANR